MNRQLITIFSIQLIIIWVLLELGLRILAPFNHNLRVLLYNPHLLGDYEQINTLEALLNTRPRGFKPYAKREGFVLNSKSFRTKEYSSQKPAGVYRIVLLGDSFTAASGGVPYSQHWGVLLEKYLNNIILANRWPVPNQLANPVEVIKLGVGGVGPRFELRLWQLEGSKLQADLVILAFCIGNDFTDEQTMALTSSWSELLLENSYVAQLIRNLYRLTGVTQPQEILLKESSADENLRGGYELIDNKVYDSNQSTFSRTAFLPIVAERMAITRPTNHAKFIALLNNLKSVLLLLRDNVAKAQAKLVILLIPDEYQVYPALLQEAANYVDTLPATYQVDLPQTALLAFCEQHQISCLDLLPAFRVPAKTPTLYRLQDTHWNIVGNQLAAQELAKYLKNSPYAPPPPTPPW